MIDLTGCVVGRLTVIGRSAHRGGAGAHARWECLCSCGEVVSVLSNHLRRAVPTRSCGCLKRERIDITGNRFGRLLAVEESGHVGRARAPAWLCLCDCGEIVRVAKCNLSSGNSSSCGCLHREEAAARFTTHGMSGTAEYNAVTYATRRARIAKAGGTFSVSDVRAIYDRQNGECVYCPARLPLSEMQRDHIVPIARGGDNWPENIQLLCRPCNQSKWALMPDEFARRMAAK